MSGPQTLYDDYLKEYGYIPKQSSYLVAYAKKSGAKLKYSDARQIITKNATNTSTEPKKIKSNKPKTSNKKKTPRKTAKKINSSKPEASKNKNVSNRPKKTSSPNKTNGASATPKKTQSEDSKTQSNKPNKSKTKSNSPKTANKKKHTAQTPKSRTPKSAKKINSSKPPPPPTVNKNVLNQPKPPNKQKKPPPPNKINNVPAPPKKTQSENAKTPNPKLPHSVNKKPNPPQSPKRPKKTPPPNQRNSFPAPPKKAQSDSKTADTELSNSVPAPPKRVHFKSISFISEPPLFRQNALAQCKSKSVPADHRKSLSTSAVKLPHPPPRSPRCNKPSTATKFPPSTDEKVSAQFIPSGPGNAKPFMCRVNYECKTQKGKQEIYDALKLLAPNPGTITYHFTAPNAVKYPLKLEFIELYYDENAYFKQLYYYTKAPQFEKAYFEHVKSKTVLTIGEHLSDKIRKIIGIKFKSRFGRSEAGYLFHENYLKSLDYADATKLMFKFHVIVPGKEENVALYFSIMDRLGAYAKESYALMFNCHRLDVEVYPNYLELISIWPNIECLLEFLQKDKVQIIMMEFKQLMIKQTDKVNRKNHVLCELYAENEIKCEVMQMIHMVFDDIGYTQQLKTDAGYILHPKANSAQLK